MSQQDNARQAGLTELLEEALPYIVFHIADSADGHIAADLERRIEEALAAQSADASNAAENSFLLGCNDVVGATRCRLAHETGHPIAKSDDMVLVRRDMVSAACHAISNQKEAHKVLTYLRAVAMSDASNAATGQPVAWRREWDGDQSDYGIWVYVDSEDAKDSVGPWQPLYAAPAAPASEPFSIDGSDYDDVEPEPASEPAGDMYLCKAWGETDLPAAAIVTGMYGVRAFLISEWLGSADATQDDGTNSLDEAMEDMQEQWDREGEAWEWSAEFEIGGISVQKIGCAAPAPAAQERERKRERYTGDPQVEWDEFWKEIVAPDGVVDVEQVKKELADFSMLLNFVPKVYDHATGGAVTYPQTLPNAVISAIDNHLRDLTEEARKEGAEEAAHQSGEAGAATPPCKGTNCGATDGVSHSLECQAEHAAAIAGGRFVK